MKSSNPSISVLVPSRGRVEALKESVRGFGRGAEVLIGADEDDPQLGAYKEAFVDSVHVFPRYGYGKLDKYYNELAKVSTGDWLLLWNDDATIRGSWLQLLSEKDPKKPHTAQFGGCDYFPLMSRKLYEIVGHFSMGGLCDTYILGLGNKAGVHIYIGTDRDINIGHERIIDQTNIDGQATLGEATKRNGFLEQEKAVEKVNRWRAMNNGKD